MPHVPRFLSALVLFAAASVCAAPPATVTDVKNPAVKELVDLRTTDAGLRFNIRYATTHNFMGRQLYLVAGAWLHRDAAKALLEVQRDLKSQGLGLEIYDAYRPLSVQQQMWDLVHDERYVSDPAINAGRHTRGTAVDVTLVDAEGKELPMPTEFDDFTRKAHRDAKGIPAEARHNSEVLEQAMTRHGFIPYPYEWWHFDLSGWEKHPPLDIPLSELEKEAVGKAGRSK